MGDRVSFRKGVILAYDQVTGENLVDVGGAQIQDIPVLGVAEAATYVPGASVGIQIVDTGGSQSWFMIGRIVRPNTQAYTDAVNRLSDSIFSASINGTGFLATDDPVGWYDCNDAIGPQLIDVPVRSSGRLLIMLSAQMFAESSSNLPGAAMSFAMSGANTLAASNTRRLLLYGGVGAPNEVGLGSTWIYLAEGLTPGLVKIVAKYQQNTGASSGGSQFQSRNLTVFSL